MIDDPPIALPWPRILTLKSLQLALSLENSVATPGTKINNKKLAQPIVTSHSRSQPWHFFHSITVSSYGCIHGFIIVQRRWGQRAVGDGVTAHMAREKRNGALEGIIKPKEEGGRLTQVHRISRHISSLDSVIEDGLGWMIRPYNQGGKEYLKREKK